MTNSYILIILEDKNHIKTKTISFAQFVTVVFLYQSTEKVHIKTFIKIDF